MQTGNDGSPLNSVGVRKHDPVNLSTMGRPRRADEGGLIFHVLNRSNAGITIFESHED